MELIVISLFLISTFSFVGIITVSFAVYSWENQKLDDMTRDVAAKTIKPKIEHLFTNFTSGQKSTTSTSHKLPSIFETNNTKLNMKIPKNVGEYLGKTLVTVKDQDYRGMFEKSFDVAKKIYANLDLYTKIGVKKLFELIAKDKTKSEVVQTPKPNSASDQTIDKIIEFNNTQDDQPTIDLSAQQQNQYDNSFAEPSEKKASSVSSGFATLDLATKSNSNSTSSSPTDEIYEKIEASILEKLQQTGLTHYDIWLELGKHYEKYGEKEKAVEVYSMVMKHSEGKNKEIARDGLIALS